MQNGGSGNDNIRGRKKMPQMPQMLAVLTACYPSSEKRKLPGLGWSSSIRHLPSWRSVRFEWLVAEFFSKHLLYECCLADTGVIEPDTYIPDKVLEVSRMNRHFCTHRHDLFRKRWQGIKADILQQDVQILLIKISRHLADCVCWQTIV